MFTAIHWNTEEVAVFFKERGINLHSTREERLDAMQSFLTMVCEHHGIRYDDLMDIEQLGNIRKLIITGDTQYAVVKPDVTLESTTSSVMPKSVGDTICKWTFV